MAGQNETLGITSSRKGEPSEVLLRKTIHFMEKCGAYREEKAKASRGRVSRGSGEYNVATGSRESLLRRCEILVSFAKANELLES